MLSCCRLFSVLQVLSFCGPLAMLGEVLVRQLPLSHFCSLPSLLSQYHSRFTKLDLRGVCTLVCCEVPIWDEQMFGFCLSHTPGKFCLLFASAQHHTLHTALLQCQLSQMLPHHPKGKRAPKRAELDRQPCSAKEERDREPSQLCLWQEIVSSVLRVSRSEIIKQHHSVSITSGLGLNLFRLLHQMVTPAVT